MKRRTIGCSELNVSPVGLGCMGFSHANGAPTEKNEAGKILRKAFDMGYTLFDTAECYTGIHADGSISYNEELVGEALKSVRSQVVIATKCGVHHAEDKGLILDSRPEVIRRSVESSLKRLGTDYIDLYYQHRIDPKVAPEEVAGVMEDLIREGKIRYWGISETTEEYLRRAHAVCPVTAIQNRYSMMARWHENLFPTVEELHIGYIAFSPMANGFLSGKYDRYTRFEAGTDYRSFMPQYTDEGFARGRELLDYLRRLAEEKQATPAQLSLAWMLGKKEWIIPIPGSRKPKRLQENLQAAEVTLSSEEIHEIDKKLNQMQFLVFGGSQAK
ncbi:MAG: aldo/keto reductase [Eubacteriales bacterium]|nr:aldo/keto reductase [Eubacteriales bacterium]